MIKVPKSTEAMDNFRAVLESAFSEYYPQGLSNDLAAITLGKLEENDQNFSINEMIELANSLPQMLNEDAINVTNPHIVHEKKGLGISVTVNGKEYRYVSPDRATPDLFKSFMGMYKHANAGYKALNWLKRNALCYYGAKNPKGQELVECYEQGRTTISWNENALTPDLTEKINEFKMNESIFIEHAGNYLAGSLEDYQRVCSLLESGGIPFSLIESASISETTQPGDIPPTTADIDLDPKKNQLNEATQVKRLPKFLYHATYAGNTDSILKRGLIPGTGSPLHGASYSPRVYLGVSLAACEEFAFLNYGINANDAPASIFRIDTSKLDSPTFYEDPAYKGKGLYIESSIPSSALKLVEDGRPALKKQQEEYQKEHSDLNHEETILKRLISLGAPKSIIAQQQKLVDKLRKHPLNESMNGASLFNTEKTGMSFYDDFLNPKDHDYKKLCKGLKGTIVMMTPDEYISKLGSAIFHCSKERVLRGVDWNNVDKYADQMRAGTKFDIPILNVAQGTQEGRHRALAAQKLGADKIPILVVQKYDPHKELGMPKSMSLFYGHSLEWTDKDGKTHMDHVGLNEEAMKAKIKEVLASGQCKK